MQEKNLRMNIFCLQIPNTIGFWFACDEKIAGLFIFLLKISSVITVFFTRKGRCGCFSTESFLHPKACCYGLWHQTKIHFFMSQPRVMPYRCPLSCDSCNNERNIRKKKKVQNTQTGKQTKVGEHINAPLWLSLRCRDSHNAQGLEKAISLSSTDLTNYPCSLIHTLWANQIHEFYIYSDVKACDTAVFSRMENERLLRSREEDGDSGDCLL